MPEYLIFVAIKMQTRLDLPSVLQRTSMREHSTEIHDWSDNRCGIDKEEVYHSADIKNKQFQVLSKDEQHAVLSEVLFLLCGMCFRDSCV